MTPIVDLDASAAAEMLAQTAVGRALLGLVPTERTWWVPDHFHIETAGAIRRMLLRQPIDAHRANKALNRLLAVPVAVAQSRPLIGEAWRHRDNITIHDAVYVVLAQHLDAPLLTADRKLAAASNLPIQVLHLSVAE